MSKVSFYKGMGVLALFGVMVQVAWLCDDAYITFRTIDNFLNGYGLRWNVVERVWTFTHPLWMMVLTGVIAITHDFYFSVLGVSLFCSVVSVILLAKHSTGRAFGLAFVILIFSKAFMDFTSSGLENPLAYLLLSCFIVAWIKDKSTLVLSLIAGLMVLNRMDHLLFCAPVLAYRFFQQPSWQCARAVVLGFSPFIAWECFALVYYGSFFPNTAYAKLWCIDVPKVLLYKNGIQYYLYSLRLDPVTLPVIGLALLSVLRKDEDRLRPIMFGVALYLVYIIHMGGDFMNGRFLSVPLLISVWVLVYQVKSCSKVQCLGLSAVALVLGLAGPFPSVLSGADYGHQDKWVANPTITRENVLDERGIYYPYTGIRKAFRAHGTGPLLIWLKPDVNLEEDIIVTGRIGLAGFRGGATVHIVDPLGLSDPLLARLPAEAAEDATVQVGHYARALPEGYLAYIDHPEKSLPDKDLNTLNVALKSITRDPLWSRERWDHIYRLNLGYYDHLVAN